MAKPEYMEGPVALENFKRLATAILQAPAKKKKSRHTSERGGWPTQARFWLEWGCSHVTDLVRRTS